MAAGALSLCSLVVCSSLPVALLLCVCDAFLTTHREKPLSSCWWQLPNAQWHSWFEKLTDKARRGHRKRGPRLPTLIWIFFRFRPKFSISPVLYAPPRRNLSVKISHGCQFFTFIRRIRFLIKLLFSSHRASLFAPAPGLDRREKWIRALMRVMRSPWLGYAPRCASIDLFHAQKDESQTRRREKKLVLGAGGRFRTRFQVSRRLNRRGKFNFKVKERKTHAAGRSFLSDVGRIRNWSWHSRTRTIIMYGHQRFTFPQNILSLSFGLIFYSNAAWMCPSLQRMAILTLSARFSECNEDISSVPVNARKLLWYQGKQCRGNFQALM